MDFFKNLVKPKVSAASDLLKVKTYEVNAFICSSLDADKLNKEQIGKQHLSK